MAYPTFGDYTTGTNGTADATSSSIIAPSNTAANDLVVLLFVKDGSDQPILPDGWTQVAATPDSGGSSYLTIWTKRLTGSLSNFSVYHPSEQTCWIIFRIAGCANPQISAVAQGESTSPNSPSLTHSFGSGAEVMWLSVAAWDYNYSCSGYPTNFSSNNISRVAGGTGGASIAMATLNSTTNPQDPDTFTIASAETWNAFTLAFVLDPISEGYHIYRKAGAGSYSDIAVDSASPYEDNSGLSNGVTYTYKIRRRLNGVWQSYSNEDFVAYSASGIALTAEQITNYIHLSWA